MTKAKATFFVIYEKAASTVAEGIQGHRVKQAGLTSADRLADQLKYAPHLAEDLHTVMAVSQEVEAHKVYVNEQRHVVWLPEFMPPV